MGRTRFAQHVGHLASFTRLVEVKASAAQESVPLGALGELTDTAGSDLPRRIENDAVHVAVQSILRRCRDDRTLIVIDDANLLDPFSLEVIHTVCASRRADITWMLTVDADTTTQHRLAELWVSDLFDIVELKDLDVTELHSVLTVGAGSSCSIAEARAIHQLCHGRLLLAHEILGVTNNECSPQALEGIDGSLRLRSAVDRLLGRNEPEACLLLDLLACHPGLHWDLVYPAWNESVIAGLERSGAIHSAGSHLSVSIPACKRSLASGVSERRRRALVRRIVDVQRDPAALPDQALVQLLLLDIGADTTIHPSVAGVAVRRALDLGDSAAARIIFESLPHRWTGDTSQLDALLAEVEASEGGGVDIAARLEVMLATHDTAARLAAVRSITEILRRGHGTTGELLAVVDSFDVGALDRRAISRLGLQRCRHLWELGSIDRCAELIKPIGPADIDRRDRQLLSDIRSGIAAHRFNCNEVSDLSAGAAVERRTLAHVLDGSIGSLPPDTDIAPGALALRAALVGDLRGSERIALNALTGEVPDHSLRHLLQTFCGQAATDADAGGLWGPWTEMFVVWRTTWESPQSTGSLVELAERHRTAGLIATATTARHLASLAPRLPFVPDGHNFPQSFVAQTMVTAANAAHADKPEVVAQAGGSFRSLGWHLSASWAFIDASSAFAERGDFVSAVGSLLASRHDATFVDSRIAPGNHPRALLSRREDAVMMAVVSGSTSKVIAAADDVSVRTVDNQIYRLCKRLGLSGRRELIGLAQQASTDPRSFQTGC